VTVVRDQVLDASGAGQDDGTTADSVLLEAVAYVTAYAAANLISADVPVPDEIVDAAILACATDLFARRKAPFGQQILADANGVPVATRLGLDPMAGAREKLAPWCVSAGFAFPEDWDA
jgi:hypothetical protein